MGHKVYNIVISIDCPIPIYPHTFAYAKGRCAVNLQGFRFNPSSEKREEKRKETSFNHLSSKH